MANIKFSGFTAVTDVAGIQEIVGYNGTANVRISPVNFINSSGGPYLPLTAGSGFPLTGDLYVGDNNPAAIYLRDSGALWLGNSLDVLLIHTFGKSYLQSRTANVPLILSGTSTVNLEKYNSGTDGDKGLSYIIDGALELYHNNVKKFETTSTGITVAGSAKIETTTNLDAKLILNPYSDGLGTSYQWNINGRGSAGNYAFQISEGSTPYLNIGNSAGGNGGNVGIGTSSPAGKLSVSNGGANGFEVHPTATITELFSYNRSTDVYTDLYLNAKNILLMPQSSGNVGIGTNTPLAKLHLSDPAIVMYLEDSDSTASYNITSISNSGNNLTLDTRNSSGGFVSTDYQIIKNTSGAEAHRWLTQGSEKMRIFSNGSLQFNSYNDSNNTGTATFLLGTDANGNVVKTSTVPGSGAGPYLPLAGGTMTGDITISKVYPKLLLNDTTGVARNFSVGTNNETFTVRNETAASDAFTINNANNATFAGNVSIVGSSSTLLTLGDTTGDTFTKIISATGGGSQIQFFNGTTQTSTINSNATNIFTVYDGAASASLGVFNIADGGNATFAGNVALPFGLISTTGGNNLTISGSVADHAGLIFATNSVLPAVVSVVNTNVVDLGQVGNVFKNLYLGSEIISDGGATFSSAVTINLDTEGTYFTGGSGGVRQLSLTSGTNSSAHALHTFNIASSNGKYKFDINGTEQLSLASGNATFAGDVLLGDNKNLDFGSATDFRIVHNSTTNVNHISSKLDRQLSINANIINLTNQANDSTYLKLESTAATFAGSVTLVNEATTTSSSELFIKGKRTDGSDGVFGEIIFSNNNDSVVKISSVRDTADNKGALQFATQNGASGFGTALTLASSGNATFTGNVSVIGSSKFIEVGSANSGTNFGFIGWNAASKYLFIGNSYSSAYNEDIKIDSSGNTTFAGDVIIGTSGKGILLGGTSAANRLDDYEEGTWTGTIKFGGGDTGITYSANTGTYTKVGRMVNYAIRFILTSKGSSTGQMTIEGMPFTAANITGNYGSSVVSFARNMSLQVNTFFTMDNSSAVIRPRYLSGTGAYSDYTDSQIADNTDLIITGSFAAA